MSEPRKITKLTAQDRPPKVAKITCGGESFQVGVEVKCIK